MMALNALIMILGLLQIKVNPMIVPLLCILIVQRLKSYSVFIFIKEIFDLRQVGNTER